MEETSLFPWRLLAMWERHIYKQHAIYSSSLLRPRHDTDLLDAYTVTGPWAPSSCQCIPY